MNQPSSLAVRHVVGAEGDEPLLRCGHMNAASLQPIQVNIPGVLESHSRDAERMGLDLIQQAVKRLRLA